MTVSFLWASMKVLFIFTVNKIRIQTQIWLHFEGFPCAPAILINNLKLIFTLVEYLWFWYAYEKVHVHCGNYRMTIKISLK